MAEENSYNTIQVMQGLEYQRKRAYINMGSTDSIDGKMPRAQLQMAQEIVSNSIDEAMSGHGNQIDITIHKDNSMTVKDHGRGIPRDYIDSDGNVTKFGSVIKIFTEIGTSGKFNNDLYNVSGGVNGIGSCGCCALSKWVIIEAQTSEYHYEVKISYDNWVNNHKPDYTKELPYDKSLGTFSKVTFLPDERALAKTNWDRKALCERYEMEAYLIPKVHITLTDERDIDDETGKPWKKEWYSENGLIDYLNAVSEGSKPLKGFSNPLFFEGNYTTKNNEKIYVHGALKWTEDVGSTLYSFVNGIPTIQGGPHLDGAIRAINKSITDYVSEKKLLGRKGSLVPSDIQDGLILALEIQVPESLMQFEGQTKEKYGSADATPATKEVISNALTKWLYDHEDDAKNLIEKMNESKQARENAIKARQEAKAAREQKKKGKANKLFVSSKLTVASPNTKPEDREIMITEGNSAAGSVIQARTSNIAVFPLRGKILNTLELPLTRVLKNEEISTITSVLGAGIGPAFDIKDLQYNKIIILTDADDDGMHIRSLCITLFYKFFKPLIDEGHLYVAEAPLFRISYYDKKAKPINNYAFSNKEKDKIVQELNEQGHHDLHITRFKGLGENNPEDLKKAVINPETRHLIRIKADDVEQANKYLRMCMGNDPNLRHEWVQNNLDVEVDEY